VQALLNNPKILIFDEPTVGLDPEERVRFRNLISELANDCIVILSSHIVSDIETIADEVAVMKSGRLITKALQAEVTEQVKGKVFEKEMGANTLVAFKEKNLVVNSIRKKENVLVRYISDEQQSNANSCAASLEDAYLFLTKK
jgi:ABC-2 type transport system ATP-binding protein